MKNLQLNGMRELSFKEIEDVSGGYLLNSVGFLVGSVSTGLGAYSGGASLGDAFKAGAAGGLVGAIAPIRTFSSLWRGALGGGIGGYTFASF